VLVMMMMVMKEREKMLMKKVNLRMAFITTTGITMRGIKKRQQVQQSSTYNRVSHNITLKSVYLVDNYRSICCLREKQSIHVVNCGVRTSVAVVFDDDDDDDCGVILIQ
ncbi:hypothetical protein BLOT_001007, partial [Blomia tropicalis]